jgi:hypothetical protein
MGCRKISGDDFDERRFAGAVVAHQPDHLSGLDLQRDIVKGVNGAEVLRDIRQFENWHRVSVLPAQNIVLVVLAFSGELVPSVCLSAGIAATNASGVPDAMKVSSPVPAREAPPLIGASR